MKHTYQVSGMTCSGCESKVKSSLLMLPEINAVEVSRENNSVQIEMNEHTSTAALQEALGTKYQINAGSSAGAMDEKRSFFETYRPVLLLFAYIITLAFLASWKNNNLHLMLFMQIFMGGFFLSFSFFKLLNLSAFADSYSMYDIIAKRLRAWGYIYAFLELGLGIAYATQFNPWLTNLVTLMVMSISIIGVLQSVLNKRKIQCACLGTVFNLPMSTLTIIEDLVMIAMSAVMLILM